MARTISSRIAVWATLALLAIALASVHRPTIAQDQGTDAKPAAAKKAKEFRGRLPNYYRMVVDEKQREAIYKIQEEYAPKIAELKAQLAAITQERDEKVAAVLTPEQLQKIEEAKAAAKAKRSQKKPARVKPAAGDAADK